jgi:ParB family transcriptional regulator, chromosome partitioning protein
VATNGSRRLNPFHTGEAANARASLPSLTGEALHAPRLSLHLPFTNLEEKKMSQHSTTKQQQHNDNGNAALRFIPLADIAPAPHNTRGKIKRASLKELTASIRAQGVLQPILVRELPTTNGHAQFEIVAGERRWRAAQAAGLTQIPATVKAFDDREALRAQLIENLQRADVHPLDEAAGFLRLQTEGELSLRELAAQVAKDARHVARRLALTNLMAEAQADFRAERITLGHALELCRLAPDIQPYALAACYETQFGAAPTDEDGTETPRRTRPVHHLVEWIASHVHLNLAHAPFALDDARLREDGLTCVECPNRTGFNPTLFADVQERDTCLHPLCYEGKCQTFVQIKQSEITTKRKQPAVLISAYYEPKTEDQTVLGRNEYQLLPRKADRCASAEPAVVATGNQIGEEQWICRDDACPDHRGKFAASPSRANSSAAPAAERQHRRQELFDVKVAEAVRQQVMRQALSSFVWPLTRADWNAIAREFFRRIPPEHQRTIAQVWGWLPEEASQFRSDETAFWERLASFSDDQLGQFLRLCSFAHYGANREMRHAVDQSAVIGLSQICQVNHTLIDATVRAEFCPKKYRAAHEAYRLAVQEGKAISKPVIFERGADAAAQVIETAIPRPRRKQVA